MVPDMVTTLGAAQLRPSSAGEKRMREGAQQFLKGHRKWVIYQSLLLLVDSNSSDYNRRSEQEAAQAQSFVDCLWRLHRCVRALFSRLRLLACSPALATRGGSAAHFALARDALCAPQSAQAEGVSSPAGASAGSPNGFPKHLVHSVPTPKLVGRVRGTLRDVSQCWESIGRCLSSWATSQASSGRDASSAQDGNSVVELLESLHRLCACMGERVLPAVDQIVSEVPHLPLGGYAHYGGVPSAAATSETSTAASGSGGSIASSVSSYMARAQARLRQAPGSIGFQESVQTQNSLRQLMMTKARLSREMRQQAKRLQELSSEKGVLTDELRALQDSHALLRSNLDVVLQDKAALVPNNVGNSVGSVPSSSAPPSPTPASTGPAGSSASAGGAPGGSSDKQSTSGDLVLGSRQRALLESLTVTTQESAALRQHGFFVDVVSLSAGEVALAAGPPEVEAFESWELAVRRVYEQHVKNLQAQVQAADGQAMELHVRMQQSMELLREQEHGKQKIRDELTAKDAQLSGVKEDIATTRKNYDQQLALLTEHICTLSQQLANKDMGLATLQANKVLCGHCGTWNTMGRLLDEAGGGQSMGLCHTCKGKVLSKT
eukprot:gnl/TRDRNA2_/TRDRNA2_120008_c0_seq1.p1 gnl/TRDRNA2_/TRDRNA2_120008_c0~~gnl/TRDRNA2_/TRDRNA2_120008_c0_seq1.p1  ORF type:complete len:641 (+),score=131.79 gnl/TRDRNA2_/TRDRNA2_120008_c0_seq1:106-1923(+)